MFIDDDKHLILYGGEKMYKSKAPIEDLLVDISQLHRDHLTRYLDSVDNLLKK